MKTLTNQWIVVMAVWSLLMLLPPSPSMACDEIASCETKLGKIEFAGETHCYTFWGEAGHGVVIEMERDSGALDPKVQL